MITFLEKVKAKINNKLSPEQILLIDNSYLHTKHKSFDSNKFHFKLIIKSEKLKKLSTEPNFCVGRCQVKSDFKKFSISF